MHTLICTVEHKAMTRLASAPPRGSGELHTILEAQRARRAQEVAVVRA